MTMTIRELRHSYDRMVAVDYTPTSLCQMAISNLVDECSQNDDTYMGMTIDKFNKIAEDVGFVKIDFPLVRFRIYYKKGMIIILFMHYEYIVTAYLFFNSDCKVSKMHCEYGLKDCLDEVSYLNIKPIDFDFIQRHEVLNEMSKILDNETLSKIMS